jgi:hypothetical protein
MMKSSLKNNDNSTHLSSPSPQPSPSRGEGDNWNYFLSDHLLEKIKLLSPGVKGCVFVTEK